MAPPAICQAVHGVGLALGGDFVGGFVGVEAQGNHQLAVGHHLAHGRGAGRKLLARAPQVRVQRIQVGPQRRGGAARASGVTGLYSAVRSVLSSTSACLRKVVPTKAGGRG
jgi:hypothetical protein